MGKILIFGGTFDPPHRGHRHLLEEAMKQEQFDRVLLIPAFVPPHKDHRPTLSFEKRAGVLMDWFGDLPGLEILDIEQKRGGKSFTVDTVAEIGRSYPEDTIYLLIGTDMFLSFETWCRFEELLQTVVLMVGSREMGDRQRLEEQKRHLEEKYICKGIILCRMEPIVCASSTIRSAGEGLAERILTHISEQLDTKRVRHTMMVAEYARNLASQNEIEEEKAYLAALLHDCTKCYPAEWHIKFAASCGICLSEDDLACPQVLHQITAPLFAQKEFGVEDRDLLSAIGCHTTGKVGMGPLDLLIFFADGCEMSRDYPGVGQLREIGQKDLKKGVLALLEHTITYVNRKNTHLHPQTVAARDDISKELQKNG